MRALPVIFLLCFLAVAAEAAVDAEATARAEAKALHTEAVRANDLWTAFQLEAWASMHELRVRPALPGVGLIGSPLLATPADIENLVDLETHILAFSGGRLYQWAPDGRPLVLSRALPFSPHRFALGFGNTHLALAAPLAENGGTSFRLATLPLRAGDAGLRRDLPTLPSEYPHEMACADDGSALAVATIGHNAAGVAITPRVLLLHGAGQRVLPGFQRTLAVGRNGAWFGGKRADGTSVLVTATTETPFRSLAAGPGIAVLLRDDGCDLVRRDGTLLPLEPPVGLGKAAEVVTVGEWLVFASGPGATTRPALDLLGNPVGGGKPQPPTCAWLRWADLLEDPATPAVGSEAMDLRIARNRSAALLRVQDHQLDLIDLSGPTPSIQPFATAAATVRDVRWNDQQAVARLDGGEWLVLDRDGKEVWSGKAGEFALQNRRYAVVVDGVGDQLTRAVVGLDLDPARRTRVPLSLPPGPWNIRIPRDGHPAVATRADGDWCAFTVTTGTVTARGDATEVGPNVPWDGHRVSGPYVGSYARLLALDGTAGLTASWAPTDAWRLGRTTAVIGRNGKVYVTGKRGDFVDLGVCEGADHFVRRNGQLLVGDVEGRVLAGFAPGPALDRQAPGLGELGEELPPGPWQVKRLEYVPPRSTNLTWNPENGLSTRRLRSPDTESMLVILGSVVLEVDAAAAKQLGRPLER